MCGIVGELLRGTEGDPRAVERIGALTALMGRRGPDDEGYWTDGHCSLGFRRLAILDLSPAGHQPMATPCGRYVLVFNGEVYNFRELRKELEQGGVRFRSTGDSEVVLHALASWGVEALARFNGMFALAFYDRVERRLLLARDHAGIKPVYYARAREGFVFASQYDQILRHPWCGALRPSPAAIGQYLRFGYIPAPAAAVEDTHLLQPGSWLSVSADGSRQVGTYYRFPVRPHPVLRGSEAHEAVDAAVTAAVRRQLVSDVPVGVLLSGGIDSPLVAARARALTDRPLRAYTIGTGGDRHDESGDAADYARQIDVRHDVEHATAETALDLLEDVSTAVGEPFADYSIFPTLMVSRLARRDVKVVLSGDGGDELFWGYAERFASVLRKASRFVQPYWLRTAQRGLRAVTGVGRWESYRMMRSVGHWYGVKHSRIPDDWLARLFPGAREELRLPDLFAYSGHELDETASWLRWNEFVGHLTMVLLKVDRASMFHSLEVRVPLLDREVVEVATSVDWTSCLDLQATTGKLPLRASLARHVSSQTSTKRGFAVPMDEWMRSSLRPLLQERVLGREEIAGVQVDRRALTRMFEQHMRGATLGWSLWVLLSLVLWEERHLRQRGSFRAVAPPGPLPNVSFADVA